MFASEIAEQSIRGLLGTIFQLQITAGILFAYATGKEAFQFYKYNTD